MTDRPNIFIRLIILLSLIRLIHIDAVAEEVSRDSLSSHQSVGLVLSGGGAKGIAHIGVIKALEDNGIPINYVAGTSMGAIVGSLYACGYTPEEMMSLIARPEFARWSTGVIDERLTYYFSKPEPTPALVTVPVARGDSLHPAPSLLPHSVINPMPMNFGFMEIYSAYTAACSRDFDRLFVPFRCVASDVVHKHKVVFSEGPLEDAVRASMSFPVVFRPIEVDGVPLYDGGIYDNFPVDVMRHDFAPSVIIGVDVHTPDAAVPSNDILTQLESMIIQNNDYELPESDGIKIHVDVSQFSLMDFDKASRIYDAGYERAMQMIDSIKGRVGTRVPAEARELARQVFKSRAPYVRFDSVSVTGGDSSQNRHIQYLFTSQMRSDTLGIDGARMAYYRAITPGRLSNLIPQAVYDPGTGLFDLCLTATVKNTFAVSAGGYITSSTNSMLYLGASYKSLSFSSISADLGVWLGQSYLAAALTGDITLHTRRPSSLGVQAVIQRQKFNESDRLFYRSSAPTFVNALQGMVRARWQIACGSSGKARLSAGYGVDRHSYYPGLTAQRCHTRFDLGQLAGGYTYNTLDNNFTPTRGVYVNVDVDGRTGRYHIGSDVSKLRRTDNYTWATGRADVSAFARLGDFFALGGNVTAAFTTLPLLDTWYATVANAPGFYPTAASYNSFNTTFHANQYVTAGLIPVWMFSNTLQLRCQLHGFMPMRRLIRESDAPDSGVRYGDWFHGGLQFFGELDAVYSLPFASLTAYLNYRTASQSYRTGSNSDWNVGIALGLYITAPGL